MVKKTMNKSKKAKVASLKVKSAVKNVKTAQTVSVKSKLDTVAACKSNGCCKVTIFVLGVILGAVLMWLLVAFSQVQYGQANTFYRIFPFLKPSGYSLNTSSSVKTVDMYSKPDLTGD
jgi:hypothetical protein